MPEHRGGGCRTGAADTAGLGLPRSKVKSAATWPWEVPRGPRGLILLPQGYRCQPPTNPIFPPRRLTNVWHVPTTRILPSAWLAAPVVWSLTSPSCPSGSFQMRRAYASRAPSTAPTRESEGLPHIKKGLFQEPLWGSYYKSGTSLPFLTPRPLTFLSFFSWSQK